MALSFSFQDVPYFPIYLQTNTINSLQYQVEAEARARRKPRFIPQISPKISKAEAVKTALAITLKGADLQTAVGAAVRRARWILSCSWMARYQEDPKTFSPTSLSTSFGSAIFNTGPFSDFPATFCRRSPGYSSKLNTDLDFQQFGNCKLVHNTTSPVLSNSQSGFGWPNKLELCTSLKMISVRSLRCWFFDL